MAESTPGTVRIRAAVASYSVIGWPAPYTPRSPLKPRMRPSKSALKPPMTDMTMISVATPSAMPTRLNPAITETNRSPRRARR